MIAANGGRVNEGESAEVSATDAPRAEPYQWVRCPGCGNGLWRIYSDRIEMPVSLRGRQRRVITVSLPGMGWLRVVCEKCSTVWDGTSQTTLHHAPADAPAELSW